MRSTGLCVLPIQDNPLPPAQKHDALEFLHFVYLLQIAAACYFDYYKNLSYPTYPFSSVHSVNLQMLFFSRSTPFLLLKECLWIHQKSHSSLRFYPDLAQTLRSPISIQTVVIQKAAAPVLPATSRVAFSMS